MDNSANNGTECLRAVVEPKDPLYPDVQYLQKRYKNPEMVREAVRRLAAALRLEDAHLSSHSAASDKASA